VLVCAVVTASLLTACSAGPSIVVPENRSVQAGALPRAATDLDTALQLEALLGQHSVVTADMMRARVRQDADLAQSANVALGQNTKELSDLLQPVIGADGRRQFAEAWAEHIQELFNYARGLATKDAAVREEARQELLEYEEDLAVFFVAQSDGRLDRSAALAAVREHVKHLVDGADAYAGQDYPAAATMYRQAYNQSFAIGSALARAFLPAGVASELDSPAVSLRSSLTRLFGEHVALVVAAMRSAIGDRGDFAAMGAALNANTLELTGAFDSLFGSAGAKGFQTRWADYVDQVMAYTLARVENDAAGQQQARAALAEFENSFAAFLSSATENRIAEPALAPVLVAHDRQLLAQIDAYVAKDFEQAQKLNQQIYGQMFAVSQQLSTAIGGTLAARLPRGGSQTGGGGAADQPAGG
jgi:hypothetical protein